MRCLENSLKFLGLLGIERNRYHFRYHSQYRYKPSYQYSNSYLQAKPYSQKSEKMALHEEAVKKAAATLGRDVLSLDSLRKNSFQCIREAIGNAQVVMLGESSHGTEEFYAFRRDLTVALVEQGGFNAVLCEGDFPPFFELNKYIGATKRKEEDSEEKSEKSLENKGKKNVETSEDLQAMKDLHARFPQWMWHNQPFRELIGMLKSHNAKASVTVPTCLLGLDIYSLFRSADEVVKYLKTADPDLAKVAIANYSTLNCFRDDPHEYTYCLHHGTVEPQAVQVAQVLQEILKKQLQLENQAYNGDAFFSGAENAHVVQAAEQYYRKSFMGGTVTWNLRDTAMADFVSHAIAYVERRNPGTRARIVIWAHNSHIGDSAATEHTLRREYNLGRLLRQRFSIENTFSLGFSTDTGTVRAATSWGAPDKVMDLIPSLSGSHGDLFHKVAECTGKKNFGFFMRGNGSFSGVVSAESNKILGVPRLQRFIGVQYVKHSERMSHYSECKINEQYDMLVHMDETSAVRRIQIDQAESAAEKNKNSLDSSYRKWDKFAEEMESDDDEYSPNETGPWG
mmetsp:Transcript_28439/g.34724  ORF Transcript_28439/g.34724 Transcript_28439/m.34724 type:complete len:567 (+) Transcript_28439:187-1887(+)